MLKRRDDVCGFPGRRWLNLSLRAVHLAGIVLLGAALLGAGEIAVGAWLTVLSGLGMVAASATALSVFWATLVLPTLLWHAPGALRHKRLF